MLKWLGALVVVDRRWWFRRSSERGTSATIAGASALFAVRSRPGVHMNATL
jgi:hypothetical protein